MLLGQLHRTKYKKHGLHRSQETLLQLHPLPESTWRDSKSAFRVLEPGYRGSEAHYTINEKEILEGHKGVQAASEEVGIEAQLFLVPQMSALYMMFK